MAIVKYKNQSGVTYAYESISIWDPEKKQSRPKRVYLGRVDDETGEIISVPKKKGRHPKETSEVKEVQAASDELDYCSLYREANKRIEVLTAQLTEEKRKNALISGENRKLTASLKEIRETVSSVLNGEN